MINTNNSRIVFINNITKNTKRLISHGIFITAVLGALYLIYWFFDKTDPTSIAYSKEYFMFLSNLFFANDNSIDVFKSTSFVFFACIIPLLLTYNLIDIVQDSLIQNEYKLMKKENKKKKKEEYINNLLQYEVIKNYSICLSINYESEKNIDIVTKNKLNSMVFGKIKNLFQKYEKDLSITYDDILIIQSSNFENYDLVYEIVLKALSKIKNMVENKYGVKMVPNLISDAYATQEKISEIKRTTEDIRKLNFKNRALSTAMFSKKYRYLKHKKYAGIPIGEYALFKDAKMNTYELNIVFKNLSRTLTSI